MDLEALRRAVDAEQDPEWVKKHGAASWAAALAVLGLEGPEEPPPSPQRQDLDWDEAQHPRDDSGKFTEGDGGESHPKVEHAARTIEGEMRTFQQKPENRRSEISAAINRTTGEVIYRNDQPYDDPVNPRGGGVDDAKYISESMNAGDQNVLHYHTHPDDNAFSDGDWKVLAWAHMGEMRVVTDGHTYSLEKTPKWDAIPWPERTPAKLQQRWNDLSDELWDKTYAEYEHKSPTEMVAELTRRINAKMADEYGVKFVARPHKHHLYALDWDESQHPRDETGKFADAGGSKGIDPNAKAYTVQGKNQYPIDRQYKREGSVYRGVTSEEAASIAKTGEIKSTERYSIPGEGTSYGEDLAESESYINWSRDNPLITGKPTFVVELERGPEHVRDRDGYWKSKTGVPATRIQHVWRFNPDGTMSGHKTLADARDDTKHLADWDESQHPRDDSGKFTSGDGDAHGGPVAGSESHIMASVASTKAHVAKVAERLKFDASRVDVVDIEPREFEVAGRQLFEGGHYSPTTGRIEVNARTLYEQPAIQGLVAHEIMHAQQHAMEKAVANEHESIRKLSNADFNKMFKASGGVRDAFVAEAERRWPLAVANAKYSMTGDAYLGTWSRVRTNRNGNLVKDPNGSQWADDPDARKTRHADMLASDGFTDYSRLYWEAYRTGVKANDSNIPFLRYRAEQETLAEVARYYDRAARGNWDGAVPAKAWRDYATAIHKATGVPQTSEPKGGRNLRADDEA